MWLQSQEGQELSAAAVQLMLKIRLSPDQKSRRVRNKIVVYYESRKRELKIRLMDEGRCDERLQARVEESTCLTYTGL